MVPSHHREFVAASRLCVLSWNRAPGSTDAPPQTPVFYVTDGDDLLVSITEGRAKTKALRRDPAISVCVLGEAMPFPYVTLFGRAHIETDPTAAFEVMARVVERMGRTLDDDGRSALRERADREQRVVLRITADRSVSNIPTPE
ncbi:MAG TPA: PPOX class F420-dependent oxidoreductase [Acidimicrobiales bacterium]|nr:PPOX class F420-dependent oxidoreductase [Acidimicrobiales bacterium]